MAAPTYIETIDTREMITPTSSSSFGSDMGFPVKIALAMPESIVVQIEIVIIKTIQSRGRQFFKS